MSSASFPLRPDMEPVDLDGYITIRDCRLCIQFLIDDNILYQFMGTVPETIPPIPRTEATISIYHDIKQLYDQQFYDAEISHYGDIFITFLNDDMAVAVEVETPARGNFTGMGVWMRQRKFYYYLASVCTVFK